MAGWSARARLSIACLGVFCVSMALAVDSYAGGSWLHPHALSHSFFENFWCDLLREPAHNGKPNGRAVLFGSVGFAALALALGPYWLEVAGFFDGWRRTFVRVAGLCSSLSTAAVALVPSDRFPAVHAPAVLTAGGLGFACGCMCSAWALRHFAEARGYAWASLLLVVAAAVNLALYVHVVYFRASDTIVLPSVQKVATLALLVWMVAGLHVSASRPKP